MDSLLIGSLNPPGIEHIVLNSSIPFAAVGEVQDVIAHSHPNKLIAVVDVVVGLFGAGTLGTQAAGLVLHGPSRTSSLTVAQRVLPISPLASVMKQRYWAPSLSAVISTRRVLVVASLLVQYTNSSEPGAWYSH